MSALLKLLVLLLTMTPFVFLAECVYSEISQSRAVQQLCVSIDPGSELPEILEKARQHNFDLRAGGLNGLDESDWFDREYARIVAWHQQRKEMPGDVAVVFSKPGMGYYACVIEHRHDAVVDAEFVDRSS